MTIHPGASLWNACASMRQDELLNLDVMPVVKEGEAREDARPRRMPRKSLASAPKRAPLQVSTQAKQGATSNPDIAGKGGGKENVPPGSMLQSEKKKGGVKFATSMTTGTVSRTGIRDSRKRSCYESRKPGGLSRLQESNRSSVQSTQTCDPIRNTRSLPREHHPSQRIGAASSVLLPRVHRPETLHEEHGVPIVELARAPADQYPILAEDIAEPQMYEESWLAYQESAIVQLLNALFVTADLARQQMGDNENADRRKRMLQLYHEAPFPLLHKRLQASMLYGALSTPKDVLSSMSRLKDDIGLRRTFLTLWTETYELSALKAAAEVVIGREVFNAGRVSGGQSSTTEPRRIKSDTRAVEAFLDTFLVRNEDAVVVKSGVGTIGNIARAASASTGRSRDGDGGAQGWPWRRTALRSLMLILLLDKGKGIGIVRDCLFLPSSPHKSSLSVLRALGGLLLPSLGDVYRTLGHLNYEVSHVQHPVEEYRYPIENLATDMRDGVRLTRVVELLLYPPSAPTRQADITVTMPAGLLLVTPLEQTNPWVLSHHLKFPCAGRAQKIHNVQVALSALDGFTGGTANRGGVLAEDVVDGHREKTVGLLWGLVCKWGLSILVEWTEVEKEVKRLEDTAKWDRPSGETNESERQSQLEHLVGFERYTFLLKAWATAIAKIHGLQISNLSSSFADGLVFESIVDQYAVYFPQPSSASHREGLEAKLKRVGCSKYFCRSNPFQPSPPKLIR